ncbi:hemagglutinin repeat-containing protein [Serratia odorifera]|uniref:hemagglutinin repeat-containing protein n=1 Tax=Serratia odorifera TaxID=618 RepID=UPI0018E71BD7|nr:hemagglutinin repeat-containing protein [Serratia odorifera]MBJ2065020.1 hemagglutinin repeat-containing protein [Serratia odorifera]
MNKHCYCLIFSRTDGALRVVSELARRCSTDSGQRRSAATSTGHRWWVTVRRVVWLLGLALFAGPVMADGIVADAAATPGLRPEVIATHNGLPQVNITAPNQAGVSHNQYQQFDVDRKGAILNNSAIMTQSQLAGMIQGNPHLDPNAAAARVILNEVNSNNPSQLRGFLEVAGGKAQVIVANPAGIICNGCGTINAGRMTLTTGRPQINADGSLAGYQIERGVVRIDGGGLNGDARHDTEYVDILARAVAVNAGVWAKQGLTVVAGRNRVSADVKTVTPLAQDGSAKPELAIDMSQMGGMYSGSIRMIGTEAGVGVRNRNGQVQASKTLTVSSDGRLSWQSDASDAVTQAGSDIQFAAKDAIDFHGKLHGGGQLTLQSRDGTLTQSGTLAAAGDVRLNAARGIQSSGHLLAGSDVNSQIVRDAGLQLVSQGDIRASGSLLSNKALNATGHRVDISGAQVAAGRTTLTALKGGVALRQSSVDSGELVVSTSGDVNAQQSKIKVGRWQLAAVNLFNQRASWSQTGDGESRFTLSAGVDNADGAIEAQRLALTAGALANQHGRLVSLNDAAQHWQVTGLLDNAGGILGSNGDLRLEAAGVDNQGGTIKTQRQLMIDSGSAINNLSGNLLAGQTLTLDAVGSLNNQLGTLIGGEMRLAVQQLDNSQGQVIGLGNLDLTASRLDNLHGLIAAGKGLNLHTGDWDNRGGTAQGETSLTATAGSVNNDQGKLLSGQRLSLNTTGNVTNGAGEISGTVLALQVAQLDNTQGKMIGLQRLELRADEGVNNTQGQLGAGEMLSVHTDGELNNRRGSLTGNGQTRVTARELHNDDGTILAETQLALTIAAGLTNRKGEIGGESLTLTAQQVDNTQGKVVARQSLALTAQRGLINAGGWLDAGNTLGVHSDGDWDNRNGSVQGGAQVVAAVRSLDNANGRLQSGGDLTLAGTGDIVNRAGRLSAQRTLAITGDSTSLFDNDGGSLQSGGALTLQSGQLTNRRSGLVLGQQALTLNLTGGWDNQGGNLTANGSTWVRAANLLNAQGAINALDRLEMQFSGKLDNGNGRIFSLLSQTLTAQEIINAQGWMGSQGSWHAVSGGFDNAQGSVQSQQDGLLTAHWLGNAKGILQSAADLVLRVAQDIDNQDGKVSAQGKMTVQGADEATLAGKINNAGGQWLAGGALHIAALSLDNTQDGQLYAQKQLRLNLNHGLDNRGGKLQGGEALTLEARWLRNTSGTIDGQQQLALRILDILDNSGGVVRSNGEQQLMAASIANSRGVFSSRDGIRLTTEQLDNAGGTLVSQGAGAYRIDRLNNPQGKLHSGATLTLDGVQVNNQGGQLVSTQGLTLKSGELDNSEQGMLSSQAALAVRAERLNNRDGGQILGTTHTDISARDIDNTAGLLQSADRLTLSHLSQLDNRHGRILANGNLEINADRPAGDSLLALLNQSGRLESAATLKLHARTVDNQNGTLLGLQALTLFAQQDYARQAGETISSNGTLSFSLSGAFTNLVDWLLPGNLVLNAASITNPASLVGKTLQLTTGALQNSGRIEADAMTLNVDSLDNAAALMGDDIAVRGRIIDNHGQPAVMAASQSLTLQTGERLTNRDGALLYSADRLQLHSDDLIENRASVIEADGDVMIEARRLDNLRQGLVIERAVDKRDYKWHRYNYYWRSYGSQVNPDKITMAPITQRLTFQDDTAAQTNRFGTLLTIDAVGKRAQVLVKDSRGQLIDLWVNYLALKPDADGSYAMTFYETRGGNQLAAIPTPYQNGFHWEHDWTQVMTWDPGMHVDIDSAPFVTDYNNFRERSESGTLTRDKLVSEGIGARMLAGGNLVLRITGQLFNDASIITANGNLTQDGGGSVDNRGYSVNERRQAFIVDHYDKDTHHWYPTFNRDETTALATLDGVITGNGSVTISGASITNITVNQAQTSRLETALNAVDAERAELDRNPLAFTVEGAARPDGDTQLTPAEQPTSPAAVTPSPLGRPLLPAELALTQLQHLDNVATFIPNNGLFSQHTAVGSPFLVVTDERFTRRDKFISSDYMLKRLGYDPAQAHKRLGDGFYEQRLVREQVLKLTGKPSVKGWDAMTQYQQLMNNGTKVAQDFQLVPGIALTPAQIAALQQDIVWLVSETVASQNGPQTVWVPKVYLAQTTLRLSGDGALIGGGNLQLSANSITNAANLLADQALLVDAGQWLHQGGVIKADSIDVQADSLTVSTNLQDALRQATISAGDIRLRGADIRLSGAKLDATDTLSLSARNDLTISAAKSSHTADLDVISGSMGNRTRGGTEQAGSRMAQVSGQWQQALGSELNAGGNLSLSAGRDVALSGSQVGAAGSTRVQAGNDINIQAETTINTTQLGASSRTSSVNNHRQEERLTLSSLSGDRGITLVAGNQLLAEGAQVVSQEGRIGVSAQDVTIKDARIRTQDQDSENKRRGKTKSHREEQTERAISIGSTFSGQQGVTIIGREGDLTVTGSALHSGQGGIALQAKRDVILDHTTDSEHRVSREESRGRKTKGQYAEETLRENVLGSTLSGRDGVTVVAQQGSITATASALHSDQGGIALQAKRDVNLNTATERESYYSEAYSEKKGFLKKRSSLSVARDATTREKGTLLSGDGVSVTAGNDLTVSGSAIAADRDVNLQAGHNVDIGAATESDTHYRLDEKKKSGLLGSGGIGFTLGKRSSKHEIDEKGTTQSQSVSTVGSNQGNVALSASNQLHVGGADLVAGKSLTLSGDSVRIDPGFDARTRKETFEQKQSGLTLALSGTAGSALNTAVSSAQQARKEGDGRLGALQNTKAALSGLQAVQAGQLDSAKGNDAANTNTVGISVSYGSQASKSETRSDSHQSQGSTLNAGQNLSIAATGKNHADGSGDITIGGSQLKAGKDLSLDAARDLSLHSAQNSESTVGKNSSQGGNIGVGIGVGSGGWGISVSAGINAGKGHERGNGLTHSETTLDAGSTLSLSSGRDTRLQGAQASGDKVTVEAGRDLTLQSEQDSDRYDARQQNISAGGSFTFGSMTGSAYMSVSRDKLNSNFDSVKEQSGLFAGRGGYDVKVGEHTQLNGAVIGSTATADKNRLETGTLGWSDIHNQADYKATHSGVSFSSGGPVGKDLLTHMAGGMLSGANNSGHADGTTRAGVSEGTLIVRDSVRQRQDITTLNRDTEHANDGSISPIFNKEKEQNRLKQVQLIGEIGGQVMDIARTQGQIRATTVGKAELEKSGVKEPGKGASKEAWAAYNEKLTNTSSYKTAQAEWGTGSAIQQGMQAATAAIQGLAGGNMAAAIAGGAAPYIANVIAQSTNDPAARALAHAAVNAAIAAAQGNNALAGAAGATAGEIAAGIIKDQLYGKDTKISDLSEEQKQTISALATLAGGLAGGLTGDSSADALAGGQAAKTTVDNNYLSSTEGRQLDKELSDCKSSGGDCQSVVEKYIEISNKNSKELVDACTGGGVACVTWEELIQGATNVANDAHPSQIRLDEKLKDPDAAALVNYLNGTDLKFLQDNITTGDRFIAVVSDPTSWPVAIMGGKNIITNAVTKGKEQLIAVGVSSAANAAIQYGTTGEVKLSDVIGSGVIGAITAGKGYNPTVTWNAAGGYYQAEMKGDDPFMGALLSKAGASAGYATGNIIKIPMDKALNPISKQYEWVPTGVWTITKPVQQNPLPVIVGNAGDSAASGLFTEGVNEALKSKKEK